MNLEAREGLRLFAMAGGLKARDSGSQLAVNPEE